MRGRGATASVTDSHQESVPGHRPSQTGGVRPGTPRLARPNKIVPEQALCDPLPPQSLCQRRGTLAC